MPPKEVGVDHDNPCEHQEPRQSTASGSSKTRSNRKFPPEHFCFTSHENSLKHFILELLRPITMIKRTTGIDIPCQYCCCMFVACFEHSKLKKTQVYWTYFITIWSINIDFQKQNHEWFIAPQKLKYYGQKFCKSSSNFVSKLWLQNKTNLAWRHLLSLKQGRFFKIKFFRSRFLFTEQWKPININWFHWCTPFLCLNFSLKHLQKQTNQPTNCSPIESIRIGTIGLDSIDWICQLIDCPSNQPPFDPNSDQTVCEC